MTNEQRARNLLMEIWDAPDRETGVALIAAAKAEYEREALERAAKWHDEQVAAYQARWHLDCRPNEQRIILLWKRDTHEESATAIRALSGDQSGTSAPVDTTGATVIVHPGGVIHMGADPAAPDPTKALARLFAKLWNERWKQSDQERTSWHYRGIEVGLLDGSELENERISLSALGRAALRLAENGG